MYFEIEVQNEKSFLVDEDGEKMLEGKVKDERFVLSFDTSVSSMEDIEELGNIYYILSEINRNIEVLDKGNGNVEISFPLE